MITKIRSTLHTSAYRYILWIFLAVFMVSSLSLGLLFRDSSNAVITINGYSVTKLEFAHKVQAIDQHIKSLQQQLGGYADYFLRTMGLLGDPSQLAMNELMREKLLLSAADKANVTSLSSNYVVEKFKNSAFTMQHLGMIVPSLFYNSLGDLNEKAIANYLSRQGISKVDFELMLEDALRQFFVTSLVPSALYVSSQSFESSLNQEYAKKRTFTLLELRVDDIIKELKKTKIPEQELKNYFKQQNNASKRYWSAEKRSGRAWKFTLDTYGVKDLSKEKFAARFSMDARRAIAQNNASALEEFIKKHAGKKISLAEKSMPKETSEEFPLIEKLFSIKTLGKAAMMFEKNDGYIIILDSIVERMFVPFEDSADAVLHDILKEKAIQKVEMSSNTLLQNNNQKLLESFKNDASNNARTIIIGSSWEHAEKQGLPVARMKKMIHPGYSLLYGLENGQGIGVVILDAIEDAAAHEAGVEEIKTLTKRLYEQELRFIGAAFIDSLQKNATIKDESAMHL